jgi:hypothetical protein
VKIEPQKEERDKLFTEAKQLGLNVKKNISTKNLKAKIEDAKKPEEDPEQD